MNLAGCPEFILDLLKLVEGLHKFRDETAAIAIHVVLRAIRRMLLDALELTVHVCVVLGSAFAAGSTGMERLAPAATYVPFSKHRKADPRTPPQRRQMCVNTGDYDSRATSMPTLAWEPTVVLRHRGSVPFGYTDKIYSRVR